MEKETIVYLDKTTAGFGMAAVIAIIFNTLLVWCKESYPGLLSWMKWVTPHHWISHGLMTIIVFLLLGVIFSRTNMKLKMSSFLWIIFISTIVSTLGIVIWFIFV
jgi:hypothetical protein